MATLKLNDVTTMTESGGTVTMADGVALGTISAGDISAGTKFYTHSHTTDWYDGGNGVFAFGTSLSIASADNPNGSKFLIWVGGGKWNTANTAISYRPSARVKEGSDFGSPGTYEGFSSYGSGTSEDGDTTLTHIYLGSMRGVDANLPGMSSTLLYHNNSGSATSLYIRTAADVYDQAPQNPAWYSGGGFSSSTGDGAVGIIALKVA